MANIAAAFQAQGSSGGGIFTNNNVTLTVSGKNVAHYVGGASLMALWSKVPPLTACCLAALSGFGSRSGLARKLPVTWG